MNFLKPNCEPSSQGGKSVPKLRTWCAAKLMESIVQVSAGVSVSIHFLQLASVLEPTLLL